MIGRKQWSVVSGQWSVKVDVPLCRPALLTTDHRPLTTVPHGFTLLELMIVISIIIILAVIAMPQYQKTIIHARETVLRDDLFQLRKVIDMYAADKGKLPQDHEELVNAGYLRAIPVDPITGQQDWRWERGVDPGSADSAEGITDVHSSSPEKSSEDTPYSEW